MRHAGRDESVAIGGAAAAVDGGRVVLPFERRLQPLCHRLSRQAGAIRCCVEGVFRSRVNFGKQDVQICSIDIHCDSPKIDLQRCAGSNDAFLDDDLICDIQSVNRALEIAKQHPIQIVSRVDNYEPSKRINGLITHVFH